MSTKNVSTKNLPSCRLGVKLGACVVYSISIYKIESTEYCIWCPDRTQAAPIGADKGLDLQKLPKDVRKARGNEIK